MNRTRPPAGSFLLDASVCDGTSDDELQLVTTAAATMTLITEFLTAGARVIGYRAPVGIREDDGLLSSQNAPSPPSGFDYRLLFAEAE